MEPKNWFIKVEENSWINLMNVTRLVRGEDYVTIDMNDERGLIKVVGTFARDLLTKTGTG